MTTFVKPDTYAALERLMTLLVRDQDAMPAADNDDSPEERAYGDLDNAIAGLNNVRDDMDDANSR